MPGQKLWLWALSREGGVWEDLLTDTDGQYVEFQAGRLFVQYSPGAHVNPITQASFDPMSASRWSETWFPLEGIGGLTDASRDGAMHVERDQDRLTVGVNAFRSVADTLRIWADDALVDEVPVRMIPLGRFHTTVDIGSAARFRVQLEGLGLDYDSDPSDRLLVRPFATHPDAVPLTPEADRMVFQARELMKGRYYAEARSLFEAALKAEPWNRESLLGMAELAYRSARYDVGLAYVTRVLQVDAYDARANFLAGTLYRAVGQVADARDAFGWATRSTGSRAAAYAQLAELMIEEGNYDEAIRYAELSIQFDRHGVPAWRALAIVGRKTGDAALAEEARRELLGVDPLHHFAPAEVYLDAPGAASGASLTEALGGEYPGQTLLELAIQYAGLGLRDDALALLDLDTGGDPGPVHQAWRAYLLDDISLLADPGDATFQFPFRRETLAVLEWAAGRDTGWTWTYLLALNLWAVDREPEASTYLHDLGDRPDHAPFYVARALLPGAARAGATSDLRRAVELDPDTRVLHVYALDAARTRFPADFNLALLYARSLLRSDRAEEAVEILSTIYVLPSENARESHSLYEQAHTLVGMEAMEADDGGRAAGHLAAALEWPESLGQGRPYEPEERLVRFLQGRVEAGRGNENDARAAFQAVVDGSPGLVGASGGTGRVGSSRLDILAIPALAALDRIADLREVAEASPESDPSHSGIVTVGDAGQFAARLAGALLEGTDGQTAAGALARDYPQLFADFEGTMILRALTGR
jgi:tetratricopeptide (TPR) repeat protein